MTESDDYSINEFIDSIMSYPTSDDLGNFLLDKLGGYSYPPSRYTVGYGYEVTEVDSSHSLRREVIRSTIPNSVVFEKILTRESSKVNLNDEIFQRVISSKVEHPQQLLEDLNTDRLSHQHYKFTSIDLPSLMEFIRRKSEYVAAVAIYGEDRCESRLKLAMVNLLSHSSDDNFTLRMDYGFAYMNCLVMRIDHPPIDPKIFQHEATMIEIGEDNYLESFDPDDVLSIKSALIQEELKTIIELVTEKIQFF
ncbi:Hypothetical protein POVR1_LOCUS468 [uncultured virus]|nr:Hypothetical protein POVR1_LOCUS468 [uncultured virus]